MNVRYSITLKSEKLAYMQMLMGCKPELQRQYNNTVARYLMGYKTLEPYAMKVARTVLRRGGASNRSSLFDLGSLEYLIKRMQDYENTYKNRRNDLRALY